MSGTPGTPGLVITEGANDDFAPETGPNSYSETPGSFVEADKVDIRRYCWYQVYGAGASGFEGWRFYQAAGLLEYRMDNCSPEEVAVAQQYLTTLRTLEAAIPGAGANLDTASAGPYVHNAREVADRTALFDDWRRRFCAFLGLPPGPGVMTSTAGAIVI